MDKEAIENDIRELIETSEAAYNRGDFDALLDRNFVKSDKLQMVSPFSLVRGYANFCRGFRQSLDQLKFGEIRYKNIDIDVLSEDYAFVKARWERLINEKTFQGYSSALFMQTEDGWRIIHDQDTWFKPDAKI